MQADPQNDAIVLLEHSALARRVRRLGEALTDGHLWERLAFLWRARRAVRAIRRSGLFDAAWYARGGVAGTPRGLVWHYVLRGAAEGRSPSPAFDTVGYVRAHPEAGFSGLNPFHHYLVHGRAAGWEPPASSSARLARQPLSDTAYRAWKAEMAFLRAPDLARWHVEEVNLPPMAVAGDGNGEAPHILLLPPGVGVAETATLELRLALAAQPEASFLYADEDRVDDQGFHAAPWFKPDWDPDLFLAGDLTGPATVMARALLERIGWNGAAPDDAGLRVLAGRAVAAGCRPVHVPKILFHRRERPELRRVAWALPDALPTVSVIIPTRNRAALLRVAADGILARTDYAPLEVIVLDNDSQETSTRLLLHELAAHSRVRVVPVPGAFNWSALNNAGARLARGEVLVLLNNDVEVIEPGWLGALVAHAMRPDVGAVGAKLLYPDGSIQHAGLTLDGAGCFCHFCRGAAADDPEVELVRSVAAVTGACLATRREVFWAVGGLEEDVLAVTGNDIDFCCRVRAAGYRVVYTPDSVLVHREAASRGVDRSDAQLARVVAERMYLRRHWGDLATRDPYMNANLCVVGYRPALEAPARLVGT